jgi:hypothetical protein
VDSGIAKKGVEIDAGRPAFAISGTGPVIVERRAKRYPNIHGRFIFED